MKNYQYRSLVFAGTFDHFHRGHKKMIDLALKLGEKVIIGVCDDQFVKNKPLSQTIENYQDRLRHLRQYLYLKKEHDRVKILKIKDVYGNTLKEKNIEAILVTENTYQNALLINKKRKEKGFRPLKVIIQPLLKADDGLPISSERIRSGEIDREGKSYWLFFNQIQFSNLVLPESLKPELRKPLGKVFLADNKDILKVSQNIIKYINQKNPVLVFTVGDFISYSLLKNHFTPDLQIFDHRCQKKEIHQKIKKVLNNNFLFKTVNHRGKININAVKTIKNAVLKILTEKAKETIFVDGEEDLLTLPLILFSPLKTLIFYGHWQLGVVGVKVEEKIKNYALSLLKKFKKE